MSSKTIRFITIDDMTKLEIGSMATKYRIVPKIDGEVLTRYQNSLTTPHFMIRKVIFNANCTIICTNTTKVVCRCHNEKFDEEKGLYIALLKLNGYTYSRLKRELERIGCMSDKAEKAYAYAMLINKYKYSDIMLTSILENAVRQNKR